MTGQEGILKCLLKCNIFFKRFSNIKPNQWTLQSKNITFKQSQKFHQIRQDFTNKEMFKNECKNKTATSALTQDLADIISSSNAFKTSTGVKDNVHSDGDCCLLHPIRLLFLNAVGGKLCVSPYHKKYPYEGRHHI